VFIIEVVTVYKNALIKLMEHIIALIKLMEHIIMNSKWSTWPTMIDLILMKLRSQWNEDPISNIHC
jgi:hypothetical protein